MQRTWARLSLTVAAAGLAAALGACTSGATKAPGPSGPTVSSLIQSMKSGFATASSVRITGSGNFNGTQGTLDLSMFRSGNIRGTIKEGALNGSVVGVGGHFYVFVDKAFVNYLHTTQHVPLSACKTICGKYVAIPKGTLGELTLSSLVKQIETGVPVATSVPSIRVTTYQGQPAYELSNDKGQQVFLAKNGTHYLLGMVDPGKFRLTFSEWNAVPPIVAPPPSKIIRG